MTIKPMTPVESGFYNSKCSNKIPDELIAFVNLRFQEHKFEFAINELIEIFELPILNYLKTEVRGAGFANLKKFYSEYGWNVEIKFSTTNWFGDNFVFIFKPIQ